MKRPALVRLSGTLTPADRLVVADYRPDVQGKPSTTELTLTLNGRPLETQHLSGCRGEFKLTATVPDELRS